MKIDKDQLYTTEEVAEILKISTITVKRYIAQKKISSIKFNGIRRIKGENIVKIINNAEDNLDSGKTNIDIRYVDELPTEIDDNRLYSFTGRTAGKVSDFTHGLHVYPAKFIPQFPRWAFRYAALEPGQVILDPFCGSGTTLVEAMIFGLNSFGIDVNPLARLLTRVKTTPIKITNNKLSLIINNIIKCAKKMQISESDFEAFPSNWQFWFPSDYLSNFIKLKKAVYRCSPQKEDIELRNFIITVLSSILKKISYLDERQIKVRYQKNKFLNKRIDVFSLFKKYCLKNINGVVRLSYLNKKVEAKVIGSYAQNIQLKKNSVDLIITSPPYLNAIDYTMAHKFNFFSIDLVSYTNFKEHCREYIGVTERAVTSKMYKKMHLTGYEEIDQIIKKIYNDNPVNKIRAYIIYHYFREMEKFLAESYRVLKPTSLCIIVVGGNKIRGHYINVPKMLIDIACKHGFELEKRFYHVLRNIRLKVNRNSNAGKIKTESVVVLKK